MGGRAGNFEILETFKFKLGFAADHKNCLSFLGPAGRGAQSSRLQSILVVYD